MNRKPTLTVAIPAFNEEIGISNVLDQTIRQNQSNFVLEKIKVYSDGSTDRTEEIVNDKIKINKTFQLVSDTKRLGKISRLNQIFKENTSDLLVVLDADIYLCSENVLGNLVKKIQENSKFVMASGHQDIKRPDNFLGKVIHADFSMWDRVRLQFPNYDSVHNFYGAIAIYKKDFAKKLRLPVDLGDEERGFIYLSAKKYGDFGYARDASILYFPPNTISDQVKLHKRTFGRNLERLEKIFGKNIFANYEIPKSYKLRGTFHEFLRNPIFATLAVFENILLKFFGDRISKPNGLWDMLASTKTKYKTIVFSNYDSTNNPHYAGGGAIAIDDISKRLSDNFEVVVYSGKHKDSKDFIENGVKHKFIGTAIFGPRFAQPIFSALLVPRVLLNNFDIWIESFVPPLSSFFLNLFSKKKVVGLIHMLPANDMKRKYKVSVKPWEDLVLKARKIFIVTSEESRDEIKNINNQADIAIIPNGRDLPSSVGLRNKYVLFMGRLEFDQKGFDLLIPAFAKSKLRKKYYLVIAGNGNDQDVLKIKSLVRSFGISTRVRFVGRVSGNEKEKLLREALCIVVPSRFETRSLTALEALSYGKPLVTFDIPGFNWIPDGISLKATAFEIPSLTKALDRTIKFSGAAGRKFSENFSYEAISEKYKDFIYGQIN